MQVSRGVQQDMVLPVLIWEKNFIDNMRADNSLSHEDKVKLFGVNFFNLGHYSNREQREHYIKVAHTVLARIAEELPGLQWVGQVLPKSHDHRHKGTASVRSSLHVILDTLLFKRLSLLAQRLDGEEELYTAALLKVQSVASTDDELKNAETAINSIVDRFGGLIVWGDQLTVKKAMEAIGSRKEDYTKLERLDYISIVLLGDLHISMAMVCKSFRALMPTETTENRGTLGNLASVLMLDASPLQMWAEGLQLGVRMLDYLRGHYIN